jgi:hypothetical protein
MVFVVAIAITIALSAEVIGVWRKPRMMEHPADWPGLVPLCVISLLGGVATLYAGWVGWILFAVAGIMGADLLVASTTGHHPIEVVILCRLLALSELAVLVMGARYLLQASAQWLTY